MAVLGTDFGHLVALMLGALCVLLGFILVARGVGATESESSLRIAGVEFKLSKVGPGVIFSLIGVLLVWLGMQSAEPKAATTAEMNNASVPAVTNTLVPAEEGLEEAADVNQTPASPPPANTSPAQVAAPAEDPAVRQRRAEADALRRGLAAMVAGQCPDSLFAPSVQQPCEAQRAYAPANLAARGDIQAIDYEGPLMPGSSVSIYRVRYPYGEMRWAVQLGGDSRLLSMFSPG